MTLGNYETHELLTELLRRSEPEQGAELQRARLELRAVERLRDELQAQIATLSVDLANARAENERLRHDLDRTPPQCAVTDPANCVYVAERARLGNPRACTFTCQRCGKLCCWCDNDCDGKAVCSACLCPEAFTDEE